MKIINWRQQNKTYQHLAEIVKYLATQEDVEARDAIRDAFMIARLVGGKKMEDKLGGKP